MDEQFELIGVDIFWHASKHLKHRELVRNIFKTLITFLQQNNLVVRELLPEGE